MSDNNITQAHKFTCSRCRRCHDSLRALKIHEARHRRDDTKEPIVKSKFECPWCDDSFKEGRALSQHANKTHAKSAIELYENRFPGCRTTCTRCAAPVKLKDQVIGYPDLCPVCSRKHIYETKQCVSWNKGLTKSTDERMAASAANMQKHYKEHGHHNTGKTKENNENVRQKAIKISLAKKGVSHSEKQKLAHHRRHLLSEQEVLTRFKAMGFTPVDRYDGMMIPMKIRCNECNNECIKSLHVAEHGGPCPTCIPLRKTSKWQQEITDYVTSLIDDVRINDRTVIRPKEIDIYVPSKKLGIECNGIFWHSEASKQYTHDHVEQKRIDCQRAGISLLVLFEDEWRDKKEIVKSMIRHRLGLSTRLYARELVLSRTKPIDVRTLFDEWHLEGAVNASFAVKLTTSDGKDVGACSIRWARSSHHQTLEIARIAFKPGVHVVGGVSKFITHAKKLAMELGVTKLLSYSDNRLGSGSAYKASGMILDGTTIPRFWWTDFYDRHDRFKFRADKKRMMTEKQVAKELGVHRIYGCSNSRWIISLNR